MNNNFKSELLWKIICLIIIVTIMIIYFIIQPIRTINWIKNDPVTYYNEMINMDMLENAKKRTELDNSFIDKYKKNKDINLEIIKSDIEKSDDVKLEMYTNIEEDAARILSKIERLDKENNKIKIGSIIIIVTIIVYVLFIILKENNNE